MFKTIANSTDCEVRFLNARNLKPFEIHRQLVKSHGGNVICDGKVRKFVRQFNEGRTNFHDEAWIRWLSIVYDGLVEKGNEKTEAVHNKIALY
ncbi:uncharacterized protein TNCV_4132731 [Trichonephila clavipes]|nr:uncharacterized protein TNCV_4132731 [Trichonephila clavipes]